MEEPMSAVNFRSISSLFVGAVFVACGFSCDFDQGQLQTGRPDEPTEQTSAALTSVKCTSNDVQVVDLHSDFRDIWAGRETADTGKQADPNVAVVVDFSTTIDPARVTAQFVPVVTDGSCGGTIASTASGSVVPPTVWGTASSDSTRPSVPAPYNVLARRSISGVVSAAGPLAAGGDVTLSSFSVNSGTTQSVGLIAGGKITLASGSVKGNVTYGTASTFPQTVSISGTKTKLSFDVEAAFQNLAALATLLNEAPATGSSVSSNGNLQLTGKISGVNVFQISADTLKQASSVQITVPSGAGVLVNVSGGNVSIQNKGFSLQGATAAGVLWNLPDAQFVQVSSVGLQGSVLAPNAWMSFDSASLNGTVVVRDFASSGSGSLQVAALNASLMLGSLLPSADVLRPAQALVSGCSYTFTVASSPALTASGKCLNKALSVTFKVAGAHSTRDMRELAGVHSDPILKTVRRLQARPGINTPVSDIWSRYASVIGSPTLVAMGMPRPDTTLPGQMLTYYQQFHQGYPVAEYGYLVATAAGVFRSANGQLAPNLPSTLPAPISQSTALQAALQYLNLSTPPWVTDPSKHPAPGVTLALVPQRINPVSADDFKLLWEVCLIGTGVLEPGGVKVDAASGKVVATYPGSISVTPSDPTILDATATYFGLTTNTVDALYGMGSQSIAVAQYKASNNAILATLANGGPSYASRLSTMYYLPGIAASPQLVVDPTPATPWTTTEPISQAMATAQWGLQRANEYMNYLAFNLGTPPTPWTYIDGAGKQQVQVWWYEPTNPGASDERYLSPSASATVAPILLTDGKTDRPVTRELVPHEYGHAFLASIRRAAGLKPDLANARESGSLEEGLADLFAVGSVHLKFGEVQGWTCVLCENGSSWARDISDPLSLQPLPSPDYYNGTAYLLDNPATTCDSNANDNCNTHHNSTVISHWGYLLSAGSASAPGLISPCMLEIEPLDSNVDVAFSRAVNISYGAAGVQIGNPPPDSTGAPNPQFVTFRDATLQVAQNQIKLNAFPSDTLRKLELAWYEVGLGPDYLSAPKDTIVRVAPADDSPSVSPWYTFAWRQDGDGMLSTNWDFQIADSLSFDTAVLKLEKDNITDTVVNDGVPYATFTMALPTNSAERFYWRVRPHTTGAWPGCYPVHSFQGTGAIGTVDDVHIAPWTPPTDGKAMPGPVAFAWTPIVEDALEYSVTYNFYIGTQDPQCQPGTATFTGLRPDYPQADPQQVEVTVDQLQPNQHYVVNVEPIGPAGFDGNPSSGGCNKFEFDTAPLSKPYSGNAAATYIGYDDPTATLVIQDLEEPQQYRIEMFAMDAQGNCSLAPASPAQLVDAAPSSSAGQYFVANLPPASGMGLCWSATAIATNGEESPPSDTLSLYYFIPTLNKTSPGGSYDDIINVSNRPYALPNNSYGANLAFTWATQPGAYDYVIRVDRWAPYFQPGVLDPQNCNVWTAAGTRGSVPDFPCKEHSAKQILHQNIVPNQSGPTYTMTLSGDVSKGRNCWTVWPEMGSSGAPQPALSWYPHFCYTSGPSPIDPTTDFIINGAPAPGSYSSAPITGHVTFAYVPDNQKDVTITSVPAGSGSSVINYDNCKADPNGGVPSLFEDYYGCEVDFTITPPKGVVPIPATTYTITASTWNSDAHPPVKDATTAITPVQKTVSIAACGERDEACCDSKCTCNITEQCWNWNLTCIADQCVRCGGYLEPCCEQNTCNPLSDGEGVTCVSGICQTCGALGSICCPPDNTCNQTTCQSGFCPPCGAAGEPCCNSNFCKSGSTCAFGMCYGNQPVQQFSVVGQPVWDVPDYYDQNTATVHVRNNGTAAGSVSLTGTLKVTCNSGLSSTCQSFGEDPSGHIGQRDLVCDGFINSLPAGTTTPNGTIYAPTVQPGGTVDFIIDFADFCNMVPFQNDGGTYVYTGNLNYTMGATCGDVSGCSFTP
jgi:choice-of-anchor A domain-containing protein